MIISHKHKYIFLHSRKTAGSSISIELLRYTGLRDIILLGRTHGILGDGLKEGVFPPPAKQLSYILNSARFEGMSFYPLLVRAWLSPKALTEEDRCRLVASLSNYHHGRTPLVQHSTAKSVRDFVGSRVWDRYYKFAFERNPWERLASLYWWRKYRRPDRVPNFAKFVDVIYRGTAKCKKKYLATHHSNWPIYTISNEVAVDFVGRFESLYEDFEKVAADIGLPRDGPLPRIKSQARPPHVTISDLYDEQTRDRVGELFEREIGLFGYAPPF